MKYFLLIIVQLTFFQIANSQTYDWGFALGSVEEDFGQHVTRDANNNTYITGYYRDTVDFDPSSAVSNLIDPASIARPSVYIAKYDAQGNHLWSKGISPSAVFQDLYVNDIVLDTNGNVYICGRFEGTVDFDPSTAVASLTPSAGFSSYILKLDNAGNYVDVHTFTGASETFGMAYRSGGLLLTGMFTGQCDFDPGSGVDTITAGAGGTDAFMVRVDTGFSHSWAKSFVGTYSKIEKALYDNAGNIILAGVFRATVDFDPSASSNTITGINAGLDNLFLCKLTSSGGFSWVNQFGVLGNNVFVGDITVDAMDQIYFTGAFLDSIDIDPGTAVSNLYAVGGSDVFVSQFTSAGALMGAKTISGSFDVLSHGIALDDSSNIYIVGGGKGTIDFDPSSTTNTFTSTNTSNNMSYICKWDNSLNYIWTSVIKSSSGSNANDVAVDDSANVYVTGNFYNIVTTEGFTGTQPTISPSGQASEIYLIKIRQPKATSTIDIFNEQDLSVYPNPNTGMFQVEVSEFVEPLQFNIYNNLGQQVQRGQLRKGQNNIYLSQPTGTYHLNIWNKQGHFSKAISIH